MSVSTFIERACAPSPCARTRTHTHAHTHTHTHTHIHSVFSLLCCPLFLSVRQSLTLSPFLFSLSALLSRPSPSFPTLSLRLCVSLICLVRGSLSAHYTTLESCLHPLHPLDSSPEPCVRPLDPPASHRAHLRGLSTFGKDSPFRPSRPQREGRMWPLHAVCVGRGTSSTLTALCAELL